MSNTKVFCHFTSSDIRRCLAAGSGFSSDSLLSAEVGFELSSGSLLSAKMASVSSAMFVQLFLGWVLVVLRVEVAVVASASPTAASATASIPPLCCSTHSFRQTRYSFDASGLLMQGRYTTSTSNGFVGGAVCFLFYNA